ncbi:MAG: hypothetical protein ACYCS7_08765 [Acidimicrobiales bacterium]
MKSAAPTASDIKAKMAASIKQGMAESSSIETSPRPTGVRDGLRDKRFTVVIPNGQHRFIKRFAVDANSDASTIARTLFAMLESDTAVAEQVRSRIQEYS